jgi:hypothetical protein
LVSLPDLVELFVLQHYQPTKIRRAGERVGQTDGETSEMTTDPEPGL